MAKMNSEIRSNMERAVAELQRAKDIFVSGQYDAAASRAADSALYSATALLLDEEIELGQHGDVMTLIDQRFVQGRKLTQEQGEKLSWLLQLARPADSSPREPLLAGEARKALEFAQSFFEAAKVIIEA